MYNIHLIVQKNQINMSVSFPLVRYGFHDHESTKTCPIYIVFFTIWKIIQNIPWYKILHWWFIYYVIIYVFWTVGCLVVFVRRSWYDHVCIYIHTWYIRVWSLKIILCVISYCLYIVIHSSMYPQCNVVCRFMFFNMFFLQFTIPWTIIAYFRQYLT